MEMESGLSCILHPQNRAWQVKYLFMNKHVSNHIKYRYSLRDLLGQERVPLSAMG